MDYTVNSMMNGLAPGYNGTHLAGPVHGDVCSSTAHITATHQLPLAHVQAATTDIIDIR
ncbi:unnamed protein product [Gongylonema pulchrum]|uniref:Homeobox protein homothorax n=1 Tax=Gongylonema pulchrum TaxID=637853 RepID=A0A183F0Y3_9BILA|nr:unnamed protein product [Gongylonema pulchrum]